jgi:hypothetical protein
MTMVPEAVGSHGWGRSARRRYHLGGTEVRGCMVRGGWHEGLELVLPFFHHLSVVDLPIQNLDIFIYPALYVFVIFLVAKV